MKAILKNYRQSPRKVRLVANLVKGKRLDYALAILSHDQKKASGQVKKILSSAFANAKDQGYEEGPEGFYVQNIFVEEGVMLKRFMPRAFGRATPIMKRASHITVNLALESERSEKQNTDSQKVKVK